MDTVSRAVPVRRVKTDKQPHPKLKLVETANQAAKNIKKTAGSRLSEEELTDLLVMLSEGVSEKMIIKRFKRKYDRGISASTMGNYRKKYASRIDQVAKDLKTQAIETGLTKKENRLRRLQELAENLEELMYDDAGEFVPTAKLVSEYREVLKLIAQESGDLRPEGAGDIIFTDMNNEQLKEALAGKLAANKDLAVIAAERAGVRPVAPEVESKKNKARVLMPIAEEVKEVVEQPQPEE
jgi:hypothetical protein